MDRYKIIAIIGIIIITQVLIRLVLVKKEKTESSTINPNIIRQPKSYLYVGIGGTIFFFVAAMFALFAPDKMVVQNVKSHRILVMIVMLCICIPYVFIILFQVNWKIEIGENSFTYSNLFGKKRTYKFTEIKVKRLSRCTRFYNNEKHIVGISYLQANWDALEKAIQKYKAELRIK